MALSFVMLTCGYVVLFYDRQMEEKRGVAIVVDNFFRVTGALKKTAQ
jgi:hypothetical protein